MSAAGEPQIEGAAASRTVECDCDALRAELERASEARDDLLCVVGHELRTPLAVISGYSRLLLDEKVGPLTDQQRHFVAESKRSCERLDALVTRLLGVAPGGMDPEPVEVAAVDGLLEQVIGFYGPHFDERGIELAWTPGADVVDSLPPVRLDRGRAEQVLSNLLGNALKYAAARVEVAATEVATPEPAIEVSVSDDGPGIPPEDRERIFEPWVRSSGSGMASGLGLGLAICRRVVEEMGGRIGVGESAAGGCRFHFTLPVAAEGA